MLRTGNKIVVSIAVIMLMLSCGDNPGGSGDLSIAVTQPGASGSTADNTFTIEWESINAPSSASVSLFYDTDTRPSGGLDQIVVNQSATGSYTWDCSGIAEGSYYIRAVVSDYSASASDYSDGTLTIDHSGGTPSITVLTPSAAGAEADTAFTVNWLSSGFDSLATVDLYYDTDTVSSSGLQQIALNLTDSGTYIWDCSAVTEGYYYIYAYVQDDTLRSNASDYSSGILAVDHGGLNPEITITQPSLSGDEADNFFTIEWLSEAPIGATVDLYYDTDTLSGSGLVEIITGVGDDGYYTWNCSAVAEGEYYIYGVITTTDGHTQNLQTASGSAQHRGRGEGSDYSAGTLTITHTTPYTIEITAPPAGGASADSVYTVEWTSDAPSGESIDLFYSVDTTGTELFVVQEDLLNTGSYQWNCSGVEEGSYYVFGVVGNTRGIGSDWSEGQLTVTHAQEYTFSFTAPPPSGDSADEEYLLQWDTNAPDSITYITLYYSDTQGGGVLHEIVIEDINVGEYTWNCAAVPEDEYWIWGYVTDKDTWIPPGTDGSGSAWSEGSLTIDHTSYTMTVTAPPAGGASADSSYTVTWTAQGGTGSLVDLFYDDDTQPGGLVDIASGLSNSGSYDWNTVAVPEGSYYVYAIIYDPSCGAPDPEAPLTDASASDYSDGPLTIAHSYFFINVIAPPPWGAQAEDEYTIQWAAESPSGSTVDLAYDTDTDPSSGLVQITTGLSWNDFEYVWNCSSIPEGEYYIYALLDDGAGSTTWDYSDGTLVIDRNPLYLWITEPNPGGATADDTFDIEWMSQGPAGRTIDLYYDEDQEPSSGLVQIILDLVTTGSNDSYRWDCSSVTPGSYYIYGILRDPLPSTDSLTHYSLGTVTISH